MSVQHWPRPLKVILKYAAVPVGIDIGVTAEKKDNVVFLAHVEQMAPNGCKRLHFLGAELHEGISICIHINRLVLKQVERKEILFFLRYRQGKMLLLCGACKNALCFFWHRAVNHIVEQALLRKRCSVLLGVE